MPVSVSCRLRQTLKVDGKTLARLGLARGRLRGHAKVYHLLGHSRTIARSVKAHHSYSRIGTVRTPYNPVVCTLELLKMAVTQTPQTAGIAETINLRATRKQKALIDKAAEALGRTRSDFMLDTLCREAESVLLDRRYFALSEEAFRKFTTMLDRPPKDNPKLRRLLETKAPWKR